MLLIRSQDIFIFMASPLGYTYSPLVRKHSPGVATFRCSLSVGLDAVPLEYNGTASRLASAYTQKPPFDATHSTSLMQFGTTEMMTLIETEKR